jgi:lactoylglutathione lyase
MSVRAVGINHIALEVGDLEAAIEFYRAVFGFPEPEREPGMAFLDMGDQFINLTDGRTAGPDTARHFGLVVDDKAAAREALTQRGIEVSNPPRLDFHDPWGNFVQVVGYRDVQFTKTPEALRGIGIRDLGKSESALQELRAKGLVE